MYYQQNPRVQLQDRRNRLYKAVSETYQNEVKYLLDFIKKTPYLNGLVQDLIAQEPQIDWPQWKAEHFQSDRTFELPDNETASAKVSYAMICECAETKEAAWNYGLYAGHGRSNDIDGYLRAFTEIFAQPFFNYLHDRIDEGSNVIYLLEKYKRRTEWFHSQELFEQAQSDTRHSEDVLDRNVREYLFDQGVDYPFSSPSSRSGKADIVANMGEEKPLVMEVKIFDPEGRGYDRAYLRRGFRQAYDYCNDYNQTVGYLVVFNCSDLNLVLKTTQENWPPRVRVGEKTIFIIVVDLKQPEQPASKRGPLTPYVIEESYLVDLLSSSHPTNN